MTEQHNADNASRVRVTALANNLIDWRMPNPLDGEPIEASGVYDWRSLRDFAAAILESDWLAEHDARVRADALRMPDDSVVVEIHDFKALLAEAKAYADLAGKVRALADEWEREWVAGQVADEPITRIIKRRHAAEALRALMCADRIPPERG